MLQPLHFGWFGGMPIKIAYGILGLALTVVTHTGVTIWLARRRDKGRPVPVWERIWAAVGWSQPLAFALTAIAALLLGHSLIWIYLATLGASLLLTRITPDGDTTARVLRLASAAALIAAVATHLTIWSGNITDPMAWYVTAALLLSAVLIAAPARNAHATTSGKPVAAE